MYVLIAHLSSFSQWTAPTWVGETLQQEFPQHRFHQIESYDQMGEHLASTEVLVGVSLRAEQLARMRRLRWIHSPAAAVHQLLSPELIASSVMVTNAASVHGPVVAEHALAQVLTLSKALHLASYYQHKRVWAKEILWDDDEHRRPREIEGSTLLIVGLGSIGNRIAESARALGMHVIATREHPEKGGAADEIHASRDLPALLPRADFVVLAAPVTQQTRSLIGEHELALMKPTAYLINVSRGELIGEDALARTLASRRIAGAALDVFQEEPLPVDSPLWQLENLLITPHTAGLTDKMWPRHYQLIAENLRRFDAGQPLLGLVDKTRGY